MKPSGATDIFVSTIIQVFEAVTERYHFLYSLKISLSSGEYVFWFAILALCAAQTQVSFWCTQNTSHNSF